MTIPPGKPIQEWEGIIEVINQAIRRREKEILALKWYQADALNYGEREYGERYAQAVEITGLAPQTLMNRCWTASKIPLGERREGLSFEHHAAVAALPAPEREQLLDMAEMENATVLDLRRLVQDRKVREAGKNPEEERAKTALEAARVALERLPQSQRVHLIVDVLILPLSQFPALERKQFLYDILEGL
jgi:hypothetical protein